MNTKEIRQHHEYLVRLSRLNMNNENWKRIDFLLSELDRLTAECQKWQEWHDAEYRDRKKYRQDANYFAGEVERTEPHI